jgi:hypothetical protein
MKKKADEKKAFDSAKAIQEHSGLLNSLSDTYSLKIAEDLMHDGVLEDAEARAFRQQLQRSMITSIVDALRTIQ